LAAPANLQRWHGLCDCLTANRRSPIVVMAGKQRRRARSRAYREHAMNLDNISRRRVLQGTAALTLGAALPLRTAFAAETTIGFIYVGSRDDYGYNQAHAAGAAALKKMPGIKVVEEEKVPETDAVEKTMESMINLDGATLLFPTSFGYYNPHMIKMAQKFPKLRFEHCGGLWSDKDPKNAGSYFGYIDEAQHVAGIVAGHMSKSGKLGFVAAKPIPQVLRNINAWTLGARLANPKVTTQVIFTGDWSMPVKEAEATNSLIDQGVDVITCHVDGPKTVVENAARRGAMVTGYHVNQSVLAPQAYLTGAEWNWEVLYPRFAKMFTSGEPIPNFYRGGLKEEIVKVSPYGPMVSAEAKKQADEVKAALTAGTYVIFKGPIVDNKGTAVIAEGVSRGQTDPELEKMSYLVDGVIGATS
jgi:simple sugar transport system substrate-binding protein